MVGLLAAGGLHDLIVQGFQFALKPFEMILKCAIHGESPRPNCSGFQFTQRLEEMALNVLSCLNAVSLLRIRAVLRLSESHSQTIPEP
jgi:hypothetical protein